MAEREEGWETDPFGRHEARRTSDGNPIKLVRDDGVESYDAPRCAAHPLRRHAPRPPVAPRRPPAGG